MKARTAATISIILLLLTYSFTLLHAEEKKYDDNVLEQAEDWLDWAAGASKEEIKEALNSEKFKNLPSIIQEAVKSNIYNVEKKKYRPKRQVEVKDPAGYWTGQENKIFSGPQQGEPLPPLKVTGVFGELDGKEFDPIALADGIPQILLFFEGSELGYKGLYIFLDNMPSIVVENAKQGLQMTAVFLGNDPDDIAKGIKTEGDYLPKRIPMGISREGREGPGSYGLNRNVAMTVIIAKDGRVLHNFAFQQIIFSSEPHVLGAIAEAIGEERETLSLWLNNTSENNMKMMKTDSKSMKDGKQKENK